MLLHVTGALLLLLLMLVGGVIVWLVVVALAAMLLGLGVSLVLMLAVRGRHLVWMVPLVHLVLFMLIDPSAAVSRWSDGLLPTWLLTGTGLPCAMLGGLVSAGLVAGVRRLLMREAGGAGGVASGVPMPLYGWESGTRMGRFGNGFVAPMEGLVHMWRRPGLWRFAIVPVLLNLAVTLLVLVMLLGAAAVFIVWIHPLFPGTWWGIVLEVIAVAVVVMVAAALGAGVWLLLNGILCGHFHAKLAAEVERGLGGGPAVLVELPVGARARDTARSVAAVVGTTFGLLLLNVIPVVGSVAAVVLGFYLNGFHFGAGMLDLPMSLRGMRWAEKLAECRRRRWETVGLGDAVMLFNFLPVIGSVLQATGVVGAVLMYRRWGGAPSAAAVGGGDLGGAVLSEVKADGARG
jgi:CysZ protein